jgi:hypothetical protein
VADRETETTTFTYRPQTREWLFETYPDAIGISEAIRAAIADARLVRSAQFEVHGLRDRTDGGEDEDEE